jgi:hypothetical protein
MKDMRLALALAGCLVVPALGGCFIEGPNDDDDYYGGSGSDSGGSWGSGWGGGGGGGDYEYGCASDAECGGTLVCTRTRECLDPSQVRKVSTLWTLRGQPASTTTCATVPRLAITFRSNAGEEFGYTPVPCAAGKHTVDKFPSRYTTVQLASEYDYSGGDVGTFDAMGIAQLDLPY